MGLAKEGGKNIYHGIKNTLVPIPAGVIKIVTGFTKAIADTLTMGPSNALRAIARGFDDVATDTKNLTQGHLGHTLVNTAFLAGLSPVRAAETAIKTLRTAGAQTTSVASQSVNNLARYTVNVLDKSFSTNPDAKPEDEKVADPIIKSVSPNTRGRRQVGKDYIPSENRFVRWTGNVKNAIVNIPGNIFRAAAETGSLVTKRGIGVLESIRILGNDIKKDWDGAFSSGQGLWKKTGNVFRSLRENVKSVGKFGKNIALEAGKLVSSPVLLVTDWVGRTMSNTIGALFTTKKRADIPDNFFEKYDGYKKRQAWIHSEPEGSVGGMRDTFSQPTQASSEPNQAEKQSETDGEGTKKSWFGEWWDKVKGRFGSGKKEKKEAQEKKEKGDKKEESGKEEWAKLRIAMIALGPNEYYAKRVAEIKNDEKIGREIKTLIGEFEAHYHEHVRLYDLCKKAIEDQSGDIAKIQEDIETIKDYKSKAKDLYDDIEEKYDAMRKKDRDNHNSLSDDIRKKKQTLSDLDREIEVKKRELEKIDDEKKKALEKDPAKSLKQKLDDLKKQFDAGKQAIASLTDAAQQAQKLGEILGLGKTIKEQFDALLKMVQGEKPQGKNAPKTDDSEQSPQSASQSKPKEIEFAGKKLYRYPYKHGDCGPAMVLDTLSFLGIDPKHKSVDEVRQIAAPGVPREDGLQMHHIMNYFEKYYGHKNISIADHGKDFIKEEGFNEIIKKIHDMKPGQFCFTTVDEHFRSFIKNSDGTLTMIDPNEDGPRMLTQDQFTNRFLIPATEYYKKNKEGRKDMNDPVYGYALAFYDPFPSS
ncbi:MAG: hypothetical protein NZL83_00395 [Candidatus Absconditabacterales bacterium]|nr:hypothetical protein [Candidatus Absconditabacterales bacterium]